MDSLHPAVKYGLFLIMLTAVVYGIFGQTVSPNERIPVVLGTMIGLTLFGLIGRKLTKDPFIGFVGASVAVIGMWLIVQVAA